MENQSFLFAGSDDEAKKIIEKSIGNIFPFSLEGKTIAYCISVYDGDTVTLAVSLKNGDVRWFDCRIKDIDTPEMKCSDTKLRVIANKAKDAVIKWLFKKWCWVDIDKKMDMYGRPLVKIYISSGMKESESIANALIAQGLAYKYDGKTKAKFTIDDSTGLLAKQL
jgi:endonuclease YncB( thermonuclease family)